MCVPVEINKELNFGEYDTELTARTQRKRRKRALWPNILLNRTER